MAQRLPAASCLIAAAIFISACGGARESDTASTSTSSPAPAATGEPDEEGPGTDLEQLAERIVRQSAGVTQGEHVLITGGAQDQELLENIAVHVRRAGAFPLVTLSSDRMGKRLFHDVPAELDTQRNTLWMKLAEHVDAVITVVDNLEEGHLADAEPARVAARANAAQPMVEAFLKRGVRQVEVGNGLYPTEWRARRYGMDYADLKKTFWEGVNVDYSSLAARAGEVSKVLAGGNEIHVTDPHGTDLKVRIQGRPVHSSDGVMSPAKAKKGGAAANVYLPAGEVYVTPVPGTAEGTIVRPIEYFEGQEIKDLRLTFAGGKLTSLTGSGPGFERMKAMYDAAGPGKEMFAVVDFGINPNIKLPADSGTGNWVPAGTVSLGMGNNVWAGGDNRSPYGFFVSLPGSSVTLDGRPIVEKGQLKM